MSSAALSRAAASTHPALQSGCSFLTRGTATRRRCSNRLRSKCRTKIQLNYCSIRFCRLRLAPSLIAQHTIPDCHQRAPSRFDEQLHSRRRHKKKSAALRPLPVQHLFEAFPSCRRSIMSSGSFWSKACQNAFDKPLQTLLDAVYGSCGATVRRARAADCALLSAV